MAMLFSCGLCLAGEIQFIEEIGEFPVVNTDYDVVVTKEQEHIQFRIRGSGPLKPAISKDAKWFIAMVDANHFWVHLGGGRLFFYSWQSETRSRVDEWTYPRMGEVKLPEEIEERMRKLVEQDR